MRVIIATPEEHDRQAALTQGLTHLLAGARPGSAPAFRTRSFDLLMSALSMVRDDSPDVYEAVTRRNRHVAEVRDNLIRPLARRAVAKPGEAPSPTQI